MNLRNVMESFLSAGDLSPAAWQSVMRDKAAPAIRSDVVAARARLAGFGIRPLSDTEVDLAVAKVIKNSDDIRAALVAAYQSAANKDTLTASLSIEGFLSDPRLAYTEASLKQAGVDLYSQRAAAKEVARPDTSFTGRKRFRAAPGGRHSELNGKVVGGLSDKFSLGERTVGNRTLPAKDIFWARGDPKDAAEWSNSTSYIEIEKVLPSGKRVWVRM